VEFVHRLRTKEELEQGQEEAADGIDERQATVAAVATIGVGAQSTLGGHDIFVRKICMTN